MRARSSASFFAFSAASRSRRANSSAALRAARSESSFAFSAASASRIAFASASRCAFCANDCEFAIESAMNLARSAAAFCSAAFCFFNSSANRFSSAKRANSSAEFFLTLVNSLYSFIWRLVALLKSSRKSKLYTLSSYTISCLTV